MPQPSMKRRVGGSVVIAAFRIPEIGAPQILVVNGTNPPWSLSGVVKGNASTVRMAAARGDVGSSKSDHGPSCRAVWVRCQSL